MAEVTWFVNNEQPSRNSVLAIINHITNKDNMVILSAIGQEAVAQAVRLIRWVNKELVSAREPHFVLGLPYMVTETNDKGACKVTKIRLISSMDLEFKNATEFDICCDVSVGDDGYPPEGG